MASCALFNLAFFALLCTLAEMYLYARHMDSANFYDSFATYQGGYMDDGYIVTDELLGYKPIAGARSEARKLVFRRPVYEVVYTIGADGRRVTPPPEAAGDTRCVVAFGGSFTFGEGVEDRESMPYVLGEILGIKVENFGFHGYGPQHMLRVVSKDLLPCQPDLVIYQGIEDHIFRSVGVTHQDNGPRYVLEDGQLVDKGRFLHPKGRWVGILKMLAVKNLAKSMLLRFYALRPPTLTGGDVQTYLEIVAASRDLLLQRYPGTDFHVIFWDSDPNAPLFQASRDGFMERSINLHLMSHIYPAFSKDRTIQKINRYDEHPNTAAHRHIAAYIATTMAPSTLRNIFSSGSRAVGSRDEAAER